MKRLKEKAKEMLNGLNVSKIINDNPFCFSGDQHINNVVKTFLTKLIEIKFKNMDELHDFIHHDFDIDEYPESFTKWMLDGEKTQYIKRALEEYNIENDTHLLNISIKLEMIFICETVVKSLIPNVPESYTNKFVVWFIGRCYNDVKHPIFGKHQLTEHQVKYSDANYKNKIYKAIRKQILKGEITPKNIEENS